MKVEINNNIYHIIVKKYDNETNYDRIVRISKNNKKNIICGYSIKNTDDNYTILSNCVNHIKGYENQTQLF